MGRSEINELFQSKALQILFAFALIGVACAAPVNADSDKDVPLQGAASETAPLQGNAERTAPLQGNVDRTAPLQGTVDRTAPLQGNVDRTAPLQGNVDRMAPLQGNVDRMAPLQGSADKQGPLNGAVQKQGATPFNSMTPSYQAIMRIVQIKDKNSKATASPPPITREEIENARTRDKVDLNQIPARTDIEERPPLRSGVETAPAPSGPEFAGRPKRSAIAVPQREYDRQRNRPDVAINTPPSREIGESVQRPSRALIAIPPPPNRVEMTPERVSMPLLNSNVLVPPNQNTQLLNPANRADIAATPQRAEQNKLRVKKRKKPNDKSIDADLANKSRVTQPAAPAPPEDETLLWDRWYEHVNSLVCRALQRTMPKHGNPAGRNRMHITVYADHKLEADIIDGSNTQFNQALLEAYRSLSGSSELQFPAGTRRTVNSYESNHEQAIPAVTAGFDSTLVHGDVENFVK